jgi:hypothetical protein
MTHKIRVRYCSICGTSLRVIDLIKREIKPLENNPKFEITYEDIKGANPAISIDGRELETDYKNYKALMYNFHQELDAIKVEEPDLFNSSKINRKKETVDNFIK